MFRLVIFSCWLLANFAPLARGRRGTQERILGGNDTDITDVPWQVAILNGPDLLCGGTIIDENYIVTAAHCIAGKDPMELSVRAGSNSYIDGGQLRDVKRGVKHPKYDPSTSNYDAAVLKLEDPLIPENGVQSVKLANTEPKEGDMVLISGWGAVNQYEKRARHLQSTLVPVSSKVSCERKLKILNAVTSVMFCAGYKDGKKDTCEGDSGGPAVVDGKLAGIVSWGQPCGNSNSPGVYTNVAHIRDWIKGQILE